jgi:hypothetical protein
VALIDQANADGRLQAGQVSITDAFDEQNDHSDLGSRHYEGRAIDFDAANETETGLGRLSGLAFIAGFDWVYYERENDGGFHLHVSHNPLQGYTTALSAAVISDALDWGQQNGLLSSSKLYKKLNHLIQDGDKKDLAKFIGYLEGATLEEIKPALQKLLLFNAKRLLATLP